MTPPTPPPPPPSPPAHPELLAALECWPKDLPLAAFGIGPASPWSRWAILGIPSGRTIRVADDPAAARASLHEIFTPPTPTTPTPPIRPPIPPRPHPDAPPMVSGWIGSLGYGLGRLIEPRAAHGSGPTDDRRWPTVLFHRCERVWCFDKLSGRWHSAAQDPLPRGPRPSGENPEVGLEVDRAAPAAYRAAVARGIEYIRAGDIYQVNLAHRVSGRCRGRGSALLARLVRAGSPWYGALLTDDAGDNRRVIASASPELFFRFDAATRTLTTRPMKGTRPSGSFAELDQSPKDRAELAMIVDLMRNDLGRVGAFGSVRVDEPRQIEAHGAVLQAVSTVSGRLRDSLTLADAVASLMPGGSITGAPKVRAMQIIEELEPAARGPYCGAIGYVSDSGDACFSMAIRTLAATGTPGPARDELAAGVADYWVGAGIVADSTPDAEWAETLVKADTAARAFGLAQPPSV